MFWTDDGSHFAAIGVERDFKTLWIDGKPLDLGDSYALPRAPAMALSPNGRHYALAITPRNSTGVAVIADDRVGNTYGKVIDDSLSIDDDGEVLYAAQRLVEGKSSHRLRAPNTPDILVLGIKEHTLDGRPILLRGQPSTIKTPEGPIIDGVFHTAYARNIVGFSPSGQHVATVVSMSRRQMLCIDGAPIGDLGAIEPMHLSFTNERQLRLVQKVSRTGQTIIESFDITLGVRDANKAAQLPASAPPLRSLTSDKTAKATNLPLAGSALPDKQAGSTAAGTNEPTGLVDPATLPKGPVPVLPTGRYDPDRIKLVPVQCAAFPISLRANVLDVTADGANVLAHDKERNCLTVASTEKTQDIRVPEASSITASLEFAKFLPGTQTVLHAWRTSQNKEAGWPAWTYTVYNGERLIGTYKGIVPNSWALSPSGERFAFAVSDGKGPYEAIVDGKVQGQVTRFGSRYDIPSPQAQERLFTFSPDGKRLAYVANTDQKAVLNVDGRIQPIDGVVACLAWSPNSQRLAYLTYKGNDKARVVVDGRPLKEYPTILPRILFSPDSSRLAYVASNKMDGPQFVVDGVKEGKTYPKIDESPLCYTLEGAVAYMAFLDKSQYTSQVAVIEGREGPMPQDGLPGVARNIYTKDGTAFVDGIAAHLMEPKASSPRVVSSDGRHLLYASHASHSSRIGSSFRLVVDGHTTSIRLRGTVQFLAMPSDDEAVVILRCNKADPIRSDVSSQWENLYPGPELSGMLMVRLKVTATQAPLQQGVADAQRRREEAQSAGKIGMQISWMPEVRTGRPDFKKYINLDSNTDKPKLASPGPSKQQMLKIIDLLLSKFTPRERLQNMLTPPSVQPILVVSLSLDRNSAWEVWMTDAEDAVEFISATQKILGSPLAEPFEPALAELKKHAQQTDSALKKLEVVKPQDSLDWDRIASALLKQTKHVWTKTTFRYGGKTFEMLTDGNFSLLPVPFDPSLHDLYSAVTRGSSPTVVASGKGLTVVEKQSPEQTLGVSAVITALADVLPLERMSVRVASLQKAESATSGQDVPQIFLSIRPPVGKPYGLVFAADNDAPQTAMDAEHMRVVVSAQQMNAFARECFLRLILEENQSYRHLSGSAGCVLTIEWPGKAKTDVCSFGWDCGMVNTLLDLRDSAPEPVAQELRKLLLPLLGEVPSRQDR